MKSKIGPGTSWGSVNITAQQRGFGSGESSTKWDLDSYLAKIYLPLCPGTTQHPLNPDKNAGLPILTHLHHPARINTAKQESDSDLSIYSQ